jgi:IclR family transcriptional regulator, KDG regulon repressor
MISAITSRTAQVERTDPATATLLPKVVTTKRTNTRSTPTTAPTPAPNSRITPRTPSTLTTRGTTHTISVQRTGPDRQTSLGKALALLDAFPEDGGWIGVSELGRRAGVSKPSAFRLLGTLEADSYVERDGANYCLGRQMFELGNRIRPCRPGGLREVALPYLTELYERTRRTVHLALLEGTQVLYLEKLERRGVQTPSRVGGRAPATCTALGKALLAFAGDDTIEQVIDEGLLRRTPRTLAEPYALQRNLDQVRLDGVAYDREEMATGLWCVAAPIMSGSRPVGALSVSGPFVDDEPIVARHVQQAASILSRLVRT